MKDLDGHEYKTLEEIAQELIDLKSPYLSDIRKIMGSAEPILVMREILNANWRK